ncbi:beta-ketoacyl synthase N-terminal-like domain-containing protein [Micromonospora sp. NPDC048905]|uniref:beta-ketoacyl synthase N-terminal-like domain-containing protein n=1 Tax=unclassified Micromonospora TaxID=2617518 RepID=UPI0033ED5533
MTELLLTRVHALTGAVPTGPEISAADTYPGSRTTWPVRIPAEAYPAPAPLGRRQLRRLSPEARLLHHAADSAGLEVPPADPQRTGVFVGSTAAGLGMYLEALRDGFCAGPTTLSPVLAPQSSYNGAASELSKGLGAQGAVMTFASGSCSGLSALVAAADCVAAGDLDVAVVAAVDVPSPVRGSFPQAEVVVVVVLESAGHVAARGARALAVLAGVAETWDRDPAAGARRAAAGADPAGRTATFVPRPQPVDRAGAGGLLTVAEALTGPLPAATLIAVSDPAGHAAAVRLTPAR